MEIDMRDRELPTLLLAASRHISVVGGSDNWDLRRTLGKEGAHKKKGQGRLFEA